MARLSNALPSPQETTPQFLTVRQVASYLHLNEKKIYALANEGAIPATKVTGKWLFPKVLVDQWLHNTSHGGVLTDRLLLAGSDDPLLQRLVTKLVARHSGNALVSYTPTGTRLGLTLLERQRADLAAIHWGPAEESEQRHPALLQLHNNVRTWVLVRAFYREQGILCANSLADQPDSLEALLSQERRWALRQSGAGTQRFLQQVLAKQKWSVSDLATVREVWSEREAAAAIIQGEVECAPGTRIVAREFGLRFIATGWEAFDLVVPKPIYFRTLFQQLLDALNDPQVVAWAENLGGYEFRDSGRLIWSGD